MALAIYRKYRPATFDDVIGQETTVRILREAARRDTLAHAYLFAGPRGTGKTTTARLVAKIANCERRGTDAAFRATGEPCNACRLCREIDEGRSLDVVEIDAASNRGIDEIRNLKENVRLAPIAARAKVFIIDEAHQLTPPAWNALLKTLEEPPASVYFVLATTEADRIPATIVSRTQQCYFRYIGLEALTSKLSRIAEREGIVIEHEALDLIAAAAEGSFRDAESLLDQLATGGTPLTVRDVEAAIGKVGFETLARFIDRLVARDLPAALQDLAAIQDGGFNLAQFTKDIIIYLRRMLVIKHAPALATVLARELVPEHLARIAAHAAHRGSAPTVLLRALIVAYGQMRYSQFPLVILEVALVESLSSPLTASSS
ncbi:MAG: DNA polymerase III subunit gamma/tau [bacterium]|nr:DNA polymerase III subunit gamma/tau [bacterium]